MLLRSKTLVAVLGLLATASFAAPADAGNRFQRHRHSGFHQHGIHRVVVRNRIDIRQRVVINIDTKRGHRRHRPHAFDTYSGDVDIVYRPGVGTWSYGTGQRTVVSVSMSSNVKIIDLTRGKTDCAMEKGVCVIRP